MWDQKLLFWQEVKKLFWSWLRRKIGGGGRETWRGWSCESRSMQLPSSNGKIGSNKAEGNGLFSSSLTPSPHANKVFWGKTSIKNQGKLKFVFLVQHFCRLLVKQKILIPVFWILIFLYSTIRGFRD